MPDVRVVGLLVAALAALMPISEAQPQAPASLPPASAPRRELQMMGFFVDTIRSGYANEQPKWARQPAANEFLAALGGQVPEDFALSFNCAVNADGGVRDCHSIFATPEVDSDKMTRILSGMMKLTKDDAELALGKEYRVTVDIALESVDASGLPRECAPLFCIPGDPPPPPPPPPQAKDPLIREVIAEANDCFWSNWEKSGDLRFAAEKAVREESAATPARSGARGRARLCEFTDRVAKMHGEAAERRAQPGCDWPRRQGDRCRPPIHGS